MVIALIITSRYLVCIVAMSTKQEDKRRSSEGMHVCESNHKLLLLLYTQE